MLLALISCQTEPVAGQVPLVGPAPTTEPLDCTQASDANPEELCGERAPAYEGACCDQASLPGMNGTVEEGVCAAEEPLEHLCARWFGTCDGCPTFFETLDQRAWRDLVPDYPDLHELSAWRCLGERTTGEDYDVIGFDLVGAWCSGTTARWWFATDGPLVTYESSWWNDSNAVGWCCDGVPTDQAHPARWGPALSSCDQIVPYTAADLGGP